MIRSSYISELHVTILEWTSDSPKTLQPSLDWIVDIMVYFYKSLFRKATCKAQCCIQEKSKEIFYFWSATDQKWRSHCCYCSFCLMLLSKAACDAAAVAEEEQDGMTLKRVLCIKPLLRAKDKAAPIPTKEASYFLSRHQINCQGQTTRSENQQKGFFIWCFS